LNHAFYTALQHATRAGDRSAIRRTFTDFQSAYTSLVDLFVTSADASAETREALITAVFGEAGTQGTADADSPAEPEGSEETRQAAPNNADDESGVNGAGAPEQPLVPVDNAALIEAIQRSGADHVAAVQTLADTIRQGFEAVGSAVEDLETRVEAVENPAPARRSAEQEDAAAPSTREEDRGDDLILRNVIGLPRRT
jgi:hypothetical protein